MEHGLWITSPCRTVGHAFRLSPSGLPGTSTPSSAAVQCPVGRTVLVRVRVTFPPWSGWRRFPAFGVGSQRHPQSSSKPQSASIAVRFGGRTIAYAMFVPSGVARIASVGLPRCRRV